MNIKHQLHFSQQNNSGQAARQCSVQASANAQISEELVYSYQGELSTSRSSMFEKLTLHMVTYYIHRVKKSHIPFSSVLLCICMN